MRARFLCGVGLLALLAAGSSSAIAADMPARPLPPVAAAPVFVPDWAGFYFGVHAGFGWGHKDFEPEEFDSNGKHDFDIPPNASPKGGVFGFQFGHNWQWGSVVGGLEIDFSGANINETNTVFFVDEPYHTFSSEVKIDSLASARGRLGWLLFPNLLAYGTAGIGWGHERVTTTDFFNPPPPPAPVTPADPRLISTTTFTNEFGWVAGAGLEWKFFPNWFLRGEWLHYDFGKASHFETAFPQDDFNVRTRVDVVRAALSYRFGP